MAKLEKLSEETLNVFETVLGETGLERQITVKFYGKKMKNEIYKVAKAGEILETELNVNAVILVDEEIFDLLDADQQKLIAEEAICGLYYDDEKDSLTINKPDIQTYTGILQKFTNEIVLQTKEVVKLALQSRSDREKEAKKK
jgi:hypothetical protein